MINQRPGVGPELLEGPGISSGSLVSYLTETFQSLPIDLTTIQGAIEIIPARLGHFPVCLAAQWVIESVTGTQVTPPTSFAGSNAAQNNFFVSGLNTTPSNANVNGASPPSLAAGPNGLIFIPTTRQVSNATVYFGISSPAAGTGGYRCIARLVCRVIWMPVNT